MFGFDIIFGIVTPLAGVWIEISQRVELLRNSIVTPLAGVWIEIELSELSVSSLSVTPLAGVWIEIRRILKKPA